MRYMTLLMWLEQFGQAKREVKLPVIGILCFSLLPQGLLLRYTDETFGWRYVILHRYTETIKHQYCLSRLYRTQNYLFLYWLGHVFTLYVSDVNNKIF